MLTKSRSTQVVFRDVFYITVISLILVGIGLPFLIDEYVRHNWTPSSFSPGYQLVFKKIVFSIPIAAIVLCKLIFDKKSISTQTWIINCLVCGAIIFFLFILKNPLVEKRNALGPVYLLLIFLFYPKLVNSNLKTCLLLFVAMIIVFPLTQALTHLQYGITELIENPSLLSAVIDRGDLSKGFMSLNYDAFVNIGIAIEATELNGFSYGFQLLSAFLFFVPRSIWAAKPDASGLVLGNHVIEEYGFNFANLSNPLVSEGYMNFGIPGVAIMAFALALTCLFFLTWLNSNDYLKKATAFYFAIHLLFLLRGDFTNGYSYFVGVFIGIYVIPKLIIKMTGTILDKKVWVNTN
ncbi:O-antigen polysaccharide polymerase Wzy [Nonlabens xiamenensis]|uniref:O-antigen polysaccharide polymerase Wzy n=1 Tax=Nonlabens xiamenensis TaxID=2341043 RepID=UPI001F0CAD7F|nr:O-antigen polysaccharide polymerase Wzy [Nonlabens xiamenensis]